MKKIITIIATIHLSIFALPHKESYQITVGTEKIFVVSPIKQEKKVVFTITNNSLSKLYMAVYSNIRGNVYYFNLLPKKFFTKSIKKRFQGESFEISFLSPVYQSIQLIPRTQYAIP